MYVSEIDKYKDKLFGLIKVTGHVEKLLNGDVYMNNLEKYIQMEKQSGVKGIGDKLEASHVFSDLEVTITSSITKEVVAIGKSSQMNFMYKGDEKRPVYCMFALHGGLLKVTHEDANYYYTELDLEKLDVEKIVEEFGDDMVLINGSVFMQRIADVFFKKGYSIQDGLVKYDNFEINSTKRLDDYWNLSNGSFFWKDEYFSNQNEYRIVITNTEIESPLTINIGDIRDISVEFKVKEFFSGEFQIIIKK